MKVLNLLTSGTFGGIEVYCRNIGLNADFNNGFCFLFGEGSIYDLMRQEGLTVFSLADGHKLSYKKYLELKKIANEYDIIVVHHGDPFLHAYYYMLMLCYPQKKFVRILHSCYSNYSFQGYGLIKKLLCDFEQRMITKRSDLIISVSEAVEKSYCIFLNSSETKLRVIYNGVGKEILEDGARASFEVKEPVKMLYLGRLSKEKGLVNLISALSKVKFDFILNVVGDGKEKGILLLRTMELGLKDKIFFVGAHSDVGNFLADCNIFIYPTLSEAFGISLVEAMAYGRVCVANAVGGIPEIIEDKVNGFLVKDISVDSLAHTIEEAVDALDNSEKMRNNARKTAARFSIKKSCKELQKAYSELCDL